MFPYRNYKKRMAVKITIIHVIACSTVVSIGILLMYWKIRSLERQLSLAQETACKALDLVEQVTSKGIDSASDAKAVSSPNAPSTPKPVPTCESREGEVSRSVVVNDPDTDTLSVSSEEIEEVLKSIATETCVVPEAPVVKPAEPSQPAKDVVSASTPVPPKENPETNVESESDEESEKASEADFSLSFSKGGDAESNFKKQTADQLRAYLKSKNQSTKGSKAELVQRALSLSC